LNPWFGPKTNGYGFGPVRWQGWALIIAVVAAGVGFAIFQVVIHMHD
jgi:hypothetical protein